MRSQGSVKKAECCTTPAPEAGVHQLQDARCESGERQPVVPRPTPQQRPRTELDRVDSLHREQSPRHPRTGQGPRPRPGPAPHSTLRPLRQTGGMPDPSTDMVVFTRDLRLRDHPALCSASGSDRLVAAFVFDEAVLVAHRSPNRLSFLLDSLSDLREQLRALGSDLVVRRGDWVQEVATLARAGRAQRVHVSEDVSALAARRTGRLAAELDRGGIELVLHPGVTVLPPGATAPSSGGPWKVFTPFHRRWSATSWRTAMAPPTSLPAGTGLRRRCAPDARRARCRPRRAVPRSSPRAARRPGSRRLKAWAATDLEHYEERHDDLPGAATSQISPYLHLGCLSPLEVATRLAERPGGAAFVRQLAWRDFYHQLLAARPEISHQDYRSRGDRWRDDPDEIAAWRDGRTGYPVVDAAMRQLRREGFMHNRARMIVASFLTKDLYVDWRVGAAHFMEWLARRRRREQPAELAVDRRDRLGHQPEPDLQPDDAVEALRPGRRLHPPLRRRARRGPGPRGPRAQRQRRGGRRATRTRSWITATPSLRTARSRQSSGLRPTRVRQRRIG